MSSVLRHTAFSKPSYQPQDIWSGLALPSLCGALFDDLEPERDCAANPRYHGACTTNSSWTY